VRKNTVSEPPTALNLHIITSAATFDRGEVRIRRNGEAVSRHCTRPEKVVKGADWRLFRPNWLRGRTWYLSRWRLPPLSDRN